MQYHITSANKNKYIELHDSLIVIVPFYFLKGDENYR